MVSLCGVAVWRRRVADAELCGSEVLNPGALPCRSLSDDGMSLGDQGVRWISLTDISAWIEENWGSLTTGRDLQQASYLLCLFLLINTTHYLPFTKYHLP